MSVRLSKEASVAMWLRKNVAFTNNFVKEWVAEHPELINESLSSLKPKPAVKDLAANQGNFLKTTSSESTSEIAHNDRREYSLLDLGDDPLLNVLLKDILSANFDLDGLSIKIAKNALLLSKGAECSVFLVENDALIPRALNVIASGVTEEIRGDRLGKEIPVSFSFDQGIVGDVVKNGVAIYTENAIKHPCYDPNVDQVIPKCSFLCMPIKAPDGHAVGAIQVCGKNKKFHFTSADVEILEDYLNSTSVAIVNNSLYEKTLWRATKLESVLELTKSLIEDTANLKSFVHKVMTLALQLIPCEVCRIFVVDNEPPGACAVIAFKVAFEMEGNCEEGEEDNMSELTIHDEVPFLELATRVAMTTETTTADSGLQAFKEDWMTGDNILCIPLLDLNNQTIGVVQLFHKLSANPFTDTDIEFCEIFAKFCGLGIHNVMKYERLLKASAKNEVAVDLLSYHADAPEEDVERLWYRSLPSLSATKLDSYYFNDLSLDDDTTVMGSVKMFHELGLVDCFHINQKVLLRWILTVKMNYKPATYHNWRHAFNVAQTMFTVITTGLMSDHLIPLEQFALMIASFCHDLDHKGTNNTLLAKSENPLVLLYSTSTVEHHHIDLCLKILNDKKSNILRSLSAVEYNAVIEVIEHAILSTDLALYFKRKEVFDELIFGRTFDWSNLRHTRLLRAMMMPACDISATAKPWHIQKRVVELVASEFFEQGNGESRASQLTPAVTIMDHYRENKLRIMQLDIIDDVAAPLYQALASLHESFQPFLEQVLENREEWEQEVKVGMKEIKNTDNSEGKQKQRKSDKKAKEDKKQLKRGSTVAKKQTKKAKKNRKKITKAKKSSSTEQGHVGTSYIDSGMSLESVSSSTHSYNSPVGSLVNDEESGEYISKKCERKKCLFRPLRFLKKLLRRSKTGKSK